MQMFLPGTHTKIYMQLFILALFIISKTREQPRCLSTHEWKHMHWINIPGAPRQWLQLSHEKEQTQHTTTWGIRKWILLSESSQTQKVTCCRFHCMIFWKRQNYRGGNTPVAARLWGRKKDLNTKGL